jgi:hypothetical protein
MENIIFKLVSGEEVIGQILTLSDMALDNIQVKNPRVLTMQQMHDGRVGASFMPLLLLIGSTDTVIIQTKNIVAHSYSINPEYEKRYLEAVTGLTLASAIK